MILCSVIKYAVQNRKFIIITGSNGQHQNKGFYNERYWLNCLTHII